MHLAKSWSQVDHAIEESITPDNHVTTCAEFTAGVPQNTAARLTPMCAELARLRSDARRVLGNPGFEDEIPNIFTHALEINDLFVSWARSVPDDWRWIAADHFKIPPGVPRALFLYQGRMDIYYDIHVAGIWNVYRTSRLRVLSIILDCIAAMDGNCSGTLHERKLVTIHELQELTDDICGTVPLNLGTRLEMQGASAVEYPYMDNMNVTQEHRRSAGALGGWLLIEPHNQPLKTAASMPYLRKGQKEWLFGQLARIMKIYNIPIADPTGAGDQVNSTSG